jgi:hypothetical protein
MIVTMFHEMKPIGVGSHPTLVEREVSARSQMLAGAHQ